MLIMQIVKAELTNNMKNHIVRGLNATPGYGAMILSKGSPEACILCRVSVRHCTE